jgi:hypothetical protein
LYNAAIIPAFATAIPSRHLAVAANLPAMPSPLYHHHQKGEHLSLLNLLLPRIITIYFSIGNVAKVFYRCIVEVDV